jgi:salicylate hydroxylase
MTETPEDFFKYNFGYDVVQDSMLAMQKLNRLWELPAKFFEKKPVPGLYPK